MIATRLTLLASVAVGVGVGIQALEGVAATPPSAASLATAIREAAYASTDQGIGENQLPSTASILFSGPHGSSLARPANVVAEASAVLPAVEPQGELLDESISVLATTVFLANLQVLLLPVLMPVVQTASAVQAIRLLRRRPSAGQLLPT
ncbi:hypothetical protein KBY97_01970 [Synechococcus sp. ATX 2A4]|nr:hypothetical protein [Synechococcus sp. ATX 2A4]